MKMMRGSRLRIERIIEGMVQHHASTSSTYVVISGICPIRTSFLHAAALMSLMRYSGPAQFLVVIGECLAH